MTARLTARGAVLAAVAAGGLALTNCGHQPSQRALSPAPVVAGAFDAITVSAAAGPRRASVTPELRRGLDPLVTARVIDVPGSLADYGLDRPVAALTYFQSGRVAAVVTVGGTNFDRTGYYVQRPGDPRVFLVLAGAVGPVLALVGAAAPAP
jgi:hypothetical protein